MRRVLLCAVIVAAASHGGIARAADADAEQIPQQVQSAVDRGLQWLAGRQNATTGEWPTDVGGGGSPTAAVTSLSAMAFMARGHVPGQGMYGENINLAVDRVLALQRPNGLIASEGWIDTMYDHGISTVMLCEAYGMLDEKRQADAGKAIAKAVRLILTAQAVQKDSDASGGWRYTPEASDSDISVSGWQLMALRGAANIGAAVPKRAIDMGIAYIKRRAEEDGGFTYGAAGIGGGSAARTGTGILALELLGQHNAKESLAGGSYLMRTPAATPDTTYYFYTEYYCAQASWQLGGNYWKNINRPIRESLLSRQHMDGSWSTTVGSEAAAGQSYATSMAILAADRAISVFADLSALRCGNLSRRLRREVRRRDGLSTRGRWCGGCARSGSHIRCWR